MYFPADGHGLSVQHFLNTMNYQHHYKNYKELPLPSSDFKDYVYDYSSNVPPQIPTLRFPSVPLVLGGHHHHANESNNQSFVQGGGGGGGGQVESRGGGSSSSFKSNSAFNKGLASNSYDHAMPSSSSLLQQQQQQQHHGQLGGGGDDSDRSGHSGGQSKDGSVKRRGRPRGSKSIKTNKAHREKTLVCGICSKAFYTKQNLQQHERIHSREYPYSCPHCEKSFCQLTQLNQHARSHESGLERRLVCHVCQKSFNKQSRLDKHMVQSHPPPVS